MIRDPQCKDGKCCCRDSWSWKEVAFAFFALLAFVALLSALAGGCSYDAQKKRDLIDSCLRGDTVAGQVARTPADCHNGVYGHGS